MELNDRQLLARAMVGYERSRFANAMLAALPSLLLPLIALALGGRIFFSIAMGLGISAAIVFFAWRGQAWGMSVPAGIKAGLFPLALALTAQQIGHLCTPQGCTSLCVLMCAAGGVIAGWVIAAAARRSPVPMITLGCGAAISLAVGSLGCSCVGVGGMLGMGLGLAASTALALAVRRPTPAR